MRETRASSRNKMRIPCKITAVLMACCLTMFFAITCHAELKSLRQGVYAEKVRIVLEGDQEPLYKIRVFGQSLLVTFNAPAQKQKLVQKDALLKEVSLAPLSKDKNSSSLMISFNGEVPAYKVTKLQKPFRLVFDFTRPGIFKRTSKVRDGISYTAQGMYLGVGVPVRTHLLRISPRYRLAPLLGEDGTIKRTSLTNMVRRYRPLAAVNASYFDKEIWVVGNLVVNGKVISLEHIPRTALVIDQNNNPAIRRGTFYTGNVIRPDGQSMPLSGINRMRVTNDLILYNEYYDARTGTNKHGLEVRLEKGRATEIKTEGNMIIRPGTEILSGHGTAKAFLQKIKQGDRVILRHGFNIRDMEKARHVVGAGPLLLREGRSCVTVDEEEIPGDIAYGRSPRTALGLTADGSVLLLVVDGRSAISKGMTLYELADFLRQEGAVTAMNFDGGGSSEMIIGKNIVNVPSDGGERTIRVGLGVFPR